MPENQGGRTIMNAPWPKPLAEEKDAWGLDDSADRLAAAKYELVSLGRNLRVRFNIPANKKVRFILRPAGDLGSQEIDVLRVLLNAEQLDTTPPSWKPEQGTPVASNALGDLFLPLAGLVDASAERARLTKDLEKTRAEIAKVREKLANPAFTSKVPPKVLEEHRQREADWQGKERQILQALADLPG